MGGSFDMRVLRGLDQDRLRIARNCSFEDAPERQMHLMHRLRPDGDRIGIGVGLIRRGRSRFEGSARIGSLIIWKRLDQGPKGHATRQYLPWRLVNVGSSGGGVSLMVNPSGDLPEKAPVNGPGGRYSPTRPGEAHRGGLFRWTVWPSRR